MVVHDYGIVKASDVLTIDRSGDDAYVFRGVKADTEGHLIVMDLQPGANLGHPFLYILKDLQFGTPVHMSLQQWPPDETKLRLRQSVALGH